MKAFPIKIVYSEKLAVSQSKKKTSLICYFRSHTFSLRSRHATRYFNLDHTFSLRSRYATRLRCLFSHVNVCY